MKQLLLILTILAFQSCKKECCNDPSDPECKNYDPCFGKEPCNFNINFDLMEVSKNRNKTLFEIYPNPSNNNSFFVKQNREETSNNLDLHIINSLGQIIHVVKLQGMQNEINLPNLSSGIYFISFISDTKIIQSNKLIVQ